jgi:hypothetical protein
MSLIKLTATTTEALGEILVTAWCDATDRKMVYGWTLPKSKECLARRLAAAVEAGKALTDLSIGTDVNGLTYVRHTPKVVGRTMAADLRAIGA